MGADVNCLMGEIKEDPANSDQDVERLLIGFLHALLKEYSAKAASPTKIEVTHVTPSTL